MGYEIKMSEIIAMRRTIEEIGASYANEIENARVAMARVTESDGLKGKTADAIRYYISEVYGETERAIKQAVIELRDKIMVYESGYIDIDGSDSAHITQETLETTVPARLNANKDQFADYASCLNGILSCVSDIYSASLPETGNISGYYETARVMTTDLNEKVGSYENQHAEDCTNVNSILDSVQAIINAQDKGTIEACTYTVGKISEMQEAQALQKSLETSEQFSSSSNVTSAHKTTSSKSKEKNANKKEQSFVSLVGKKAIGAATIICTGGVASPILVIKMGKGFRKMNGSILSGLSMSAMFAGE